MEVIFRNKHCWVTPLGEFPAPGSEFEKRTESEAAIRTGTFEFRTLV
jgi:hypothetical protein